MCIYTTDYTQRDGYYIKLTLCSTHHVLHTSCNVPPSTNSSGEVVLWLLCQPVLHRPPHPNWSYVHVERLLGTKRNENCWVPNPMNMADGITPPPLNPEFASRYDGLYAVRRCHAADTKPKDNKPRRFLRNCWLKLIPENITVPFTVRCLPLLQLTFQNQVINGRVILRIV